MKQTSIQHSPQQSSTRPGPVREDGFVRSFLKLCKIKISIFAALSAATGYILYTSELAAQMIAPVLGVFLAACGACALNQYQELHTDALMNRTKNRPIPAGAIKPALALQCAAALIFTGILILSFTGHPVVLCLGLFAVIWYNGVYTYLKRRTAFAAVPGALIGTVPPAVGWVAGGGKITDFELLALCFLFFMWQVPHFWLLLLSNQNDYEKANLPALSTIFGEERLARVISIWVNATAVSCLMIPLYGISSNIFAITLITAVAVLFACNSLKLLNSCSDSCKFQLAFSRINALVLIIMLVLNIESLFVY
jgi:protoheme IX farnesyltransferase